MSAAVRVCPGKCDILETIQAKEATPGKLATAPVQLCQASAESPEIELNPFNMGTLSVSEASPVQDLGTTLTDTIASERSSSATTATDGAGCSADAPGSTCFDATFLPDVTVLAAHMHQLDLRSCEAPAGEEEAQTAFHQECAKEETRQLHPQAVEQRDPGSHRPQPTGVSEEMPRSPSGKSNEIKDVGLLRGHEALQQRGGCACNPYKPSASVPATTGKARGSDTSDQVYRLGLLLRQLGRLGKVRRCWEIWQEMVNTEGKPSFLYLARPLVGVPLKPQQRGGLKPNAVSYGCILDALVSNGALDLALKLLADMKASNEAIRPNTVMYSTLIKGCAQSKQLDQALSLFEEMATFGVEVNTVTYNSLLDVCARVGAMDRAAALLDDMLKKGVQPDLITFSTIIKGYCAHGQMDKGLLLLKAMKQKSISPDGVLYNSLLDGCVRAGRSSLCLELWREMQARQIKPSNFTLSILIKLHGRMRQLPVAFELVKQLPKMYDFKLNAHVYTCLMAACIENRQYRAAYDVLQNMRREGVTADSKTVSTIVFGCLKGRMHAQAVEVVLNALESLRDVNSKAQGRHAQRGRQGGSGSSRKQGLPAIDEKTVRLLAYHLRDQHMHKECALVLDTAVSVGLMSSATAQSLLTDEGFGERKASHVVTSNRAGSISPPHPASREARALARTAARGERLTWPRGGLPPVNARSQEAPMGHRRWTSIRSREARRSGYRGAKEGYAFPDVGGQPEGYLTFYPNAPHQNVQDCTTVSQERCSEPKAQLYPSTTISQTSYPLQRERDSQRSSAAHPLGQLHPNVSLSGEDPVPQMPVPTTGCAPFGSKGGSAALSMTRNTAIAQNASPSLRLSPYLTEGNLPLEGLKLPSPLPADLYGLGESSESGYFWGLSPMGTTPPPAGYGFSAVPPPVLPGTLPHAAELYIDENNFLENIEGFSMGAEGSFFVHIPTALLGTSVPPQDCRKSRVRPTPRARVFEGRRTASIPSSCFSRNQEVEEFFAASKNSRCPRPLGKFPSQGWCRPAEDEVLCLLTHQQRLVEVPDTTRHLTGGLHSTSCGSGNNHC
ncbi:ppr repeat-containing protein [Cyclospora cayetanensis]|uniref:Ppr repeat-containing protein n=1 Tax=Cyclospora cayetanensis TaxID=88456 RepID=A0A1D3D7F9_9EIME|nr:ppr repeat-containing protein [Cyclospora cayetanensis]